MPRQLSTQNATITTAAVEVKTLTISGKQVTLSVFRQLQEEPLLTSDGALNGNPWGIVNYHPEKCAGSQFAHWHVIWQRGAELLRARVDRIAPFDKGGRDSHGEVRYEPRLCTSETADKVLTATVLAWLTGRRDTCPLRETGHTWIGAKHFENVSYYGSGHGFSVMARASEAAVNAANARADLLQARAQLAEAEGELRENTVRQVKTWAMDHGQGQVQRAQAKESECLTADASAHDALAQQVKSWGLTHEQVMANHKAEVQAEADWRQRYRDTLTALSELPQLFIAV